MKGPGPTTIKTSSAAETLPTEVLLQVFQNLHGNDLLSSAMTSSSWKEEALHLKWATDVVPLWALLKIAFPSVEVPENGTVTLPDGWDRTDREHWSRMLERAKLIRTLTFHQPIPDAMLRFIERGLEKVDRAHMCPSLVGLVARKFDDVISPTIRLIVPPSLETFAFETHLDPTSLLFDLTEIAPNLRSLEMNCYTTHEQGMLAQFAELRELTIQGWLFPPTLSEIARGCWELETLKLVTLYTEDWDSQSTIDPWGQTIVFPKLVALDFSGMQDTDMQRAILSELSMPSLKEVRLGVDNDFEGFGDDDDDDDDDDAEATNVNEDGSAHSIPFMDTLAKESPSVTKCMFYVEPKIKQLHFNVALASKFHNIRSLEFTFVPTNFFDDLTVADRLFPHLAQLEELILISFTRHGDPIEGQSLAFLQKIGINLKQLQRLVLTLDASGFDSSPAVKKAFSSSLKSVQFDPVYVAKSRVKPLAKYLAKLCPSVHDWTTSVVVCDNAKTRRKHAGAADSVNQSDLYRESLRLKTAIEACIEKGADSDQYAQQLLEKALAAHEPFDTLAASRRNAAWQVIMDQQGGDKKRGAKDGDEMDDFKDSDWEWECECCGYGHKKSQVYGD